jgi:hypothetical protein
MVNVIYGECLYAKCCLGRVSLFLVSLFTVSLMFSVIYAECHLCSVLFILIAVYPEYKKRLFPG